MLPLIMAAVALLQKQKQAQEEQRANQLKAARGEFNNSPVPQQKGLSLGDAAGIAGGAMGGGAGAALQAGGAAASAAAPPTAPPLAPSTDKALTAAGFDGKDAPSNKDILDASPAPMFDEQGKQKKENPDDFMNGLMSYTKTGGY